MIITEFTPVAKPSAAPGSTTVASGLINPVTNQPYTRQELRDLYAQQELPQTPVAKPVALPQATSSSAGMPSKIAYSGIPGLQKAKPVTDFSKNWFGGYNYNTAPTKTSTAPTKTSVAPAAPAAPTAPTAIKAPAAPKVGKVSPVPPAGAPTADERAKLDQRIAAALKEPVAEMLELAETKDDIQRIKRFIDQTFIRHNAVNESAMATRNQLIEHVTYQGAIKCKQSNQS